MKRIILATSFVALTAFAVSPAAAQYGSPVPQPQLSPYLYLTRGGQQGYLNYRQALEQSQPNVPYTPPPQAAGPNRVTNFQSNPQTTGIAPNTTTGHADTRGSIYTFMNYSHFYTIRPPGGRPY